MVPLALAVALATWTPPLQGQDEPPTELSPEQLDDLLAPIALYPDPLLAQVLVASTFPDEIDEAARFLRAGADPDDIDSQSWELSVKAVAHYPTALYAMADKLDWTTALGQAYATQTSEVMASVQRLRAEAGAEGNLVTTPQQEVDESGAHIEVVPADPQYIYVPVYDPAIVFVAHGGFFPGERFPIGAWLNYDCDWGALRVYYHGWRNSGGWAGRSRPYVNTTSVYVNENLRRVVTNSAVLNRRVVYGGAKSHERDPRIDAFRGRQTPRTPQRPESPAFGGNRDAIGARAASARGQASRTEMSHPRPAPRAESRPAAETHAK
jgi:hypothetical protein